MNKRIVLLFVLGLLLCNVYNVVATPTTSLSDTETEMLYFITGLGYCALLCFLIRYVILEFHLKKETLIFVSTLIAIFIAFFIVFFLKTQNCISSNDAGELFVIMCASSIFICGFGSIIFEPEEEKNKKIKQLNIKTKKVSFVLSIPSFIIAYLIWEFGIIEMVLLLFVIPIMIVYKWWRLKTFYENWVVETC
jgi:hypothetical protein